LSLLCLLQAAFPEQRQFLMTSSQGTFGGATTNWYGMTVHDSSLLPSAGACRS
jgi:hypothetical protein